MKAKPKTRYVAASPQTWELVRAAYLSGLSAPTAAARFGVSVTALRKRAAREGWTKRDFAAVQGAVQPPHAPVAQAPRDLIDAGLDAIVEQHMVPLYLEPEQVTRRALGLSARALAEGRALDAERLARAAKAIASLGDALVGCGWGGRGYDDEDEQADPDGRRAYLRSMAVTIALNLAEKIAAGKPLPAEFEAVLAERRAFEQ